MCVGRHLWLTKWDTSRLGPNLFFMYYQSLNQPLQWLQIRYSWLYLPLLWLELSDGIFKRHNADIKTHIRDMNWEEVRVWMLSTHHTHFLILIMQAIMLKQWNFITFHSFFNGVSTRSRSWCLQLKPIKFLYLYFVM